MKKTLLIICLFTKAACQLNAQVTQAANGNVGIGASTPGSKLHVYSTVQADDITVENTATNGSSSFFLKPNGNQWSFGATASSNPLFTNSFFVYNINGTTPGAKFLINSAGNVGIGNTTPAAKLHIGASLSGQAGITLGNVGDTGKLSVPYGATTGGYNIDFQGYRDITPNQIGARIRGERINNWGSTALMQSMDLAFYTSTGADPSQLTEKVRINSAGDLVINHTLSRAKLTIAAPDRTIKSALAIRQSNALNYGFDLGLDQSLDGNMYLKMIQNDAVAKENVMVFDRTKGYVGVGTSPKAPFHVATSGYAGDDAWLLIQRRDANTASMGLNLFPSGTVSNTNKAWGLGVWGGSNDLRLWSWNGTDNNIFLTALGSNGYVGIGTTNPQEMLSVKGTVLAQKVRVSVKTQDWPDYVFSKDYKLRPLNSLETYINKSSHLPDVPSASEVERGGLDIGSTQAVLLRKIEELSLYVIELNKKIEKLEKDK